MKENFIKLINIAIKPVVDKKLGNCDFNIYAIQTKKHDWGDVVYLFVDVECTNKLTNELKQFIEDELKKVSKYIGFDSQLVEIYINQRPIFPLDDLDEEKRPYQEKIIGNIKKRVFSENVDTDELVWHRDRLDRHVYIEKNNGWLLQMDNKLPKLMQEGRTYFIPKETYHRVIKGTGDLVIKIEEIV